MVSLRQRGAAATARRTIAVPAKPTHHVGVPPSAASIAIIAIGAAVATAVTILGARPRPALIATRVAQPICRAAPVVIVRLCGVIHVTVGVPVPRPVAAVPRPVLRMRASPAAVVFVPIALRAARIGATPLTKVARVTPTVPAAAVTHISSVPATRCGAFVCTAAVVTLPAMVPVCIAIAAVAVAVSISQLRTNCRALCGASCAPTRQRTAVVRAGARTVAIPVAVAERRPAAAVVAVAAPRPSCDSQGSGPCIIVPVPPLLGTTRIAEPMGASLAVGGILRAHHTPVIRTGGHGGAVGRSSVGKLRPSCTGTGTSSNTGRRVVPVPRVSKATRVAELVSAMRHRRAARRPTQRAVVAVPGAGYVWGAGQALGGPRVDGMLHVVAVRAWRAMQTQRAHGPTMQFATTTPTDIAVCSAVSAPGWRFGGASGST